jgi:hypothetical protein
MITKQQIVFAILFIPLASKAQHKTEHTNMLWTGYYNTVRFNKNWSLVSDAQLRTKDWTEKWSQLLIRSGLSYAFNDHIMVTVGFAFFKNAQYVEKQLFLKNEWRPWQEISYQVKLNKINLTQRIRTEQRFLQQLVNNILAKTYEYIFRFRYRFDLQIPLQETNLKLLLGNEVMVNPLYINTTRFFDQDRIFAALNYKLTNHTSLQLQYLKIFQWHSNTSVLDDANVFRLNIYQQFSFKKNQHLK